MPDVTTDLQKAADADQQSQDYGPIFEKLPEEKIAELRSVIQACKKRDMWARMVELIRCTLRRYFWLGIQHGFWNADTNQLQIGPNGGSAENLNEEDLFAGDFNIYTQNGKIFIAVFSQNAASSRAEPDSPGDAQSVKAAEEAEKYIKVYQKYNPPKVAQQEVGRLLYTDGRVISVTEYGELDDDQGFDQDEEGNPVPKMTELTEYEGVLETKVPFIGKFKEWPYCNVSKEKDILTAKDENPQFATKLENSSKGQQPNDEIARMSRISTAENIAQVSSDTLAYLVTEERWWLRPAAFRDLPEDKQAFWIGGDSKDEAGQKTQIKGIFPKGARVKMFGSVYCGAKAVAMSDEIRCMHAMPGNGNSRPSLSDAMIPIQMEFNDAMGMFSEMLHKCIPRLHVNCSAEELSALLEQTARYGEYSPFTNPSPASPLENNFYPEPQINMPEGFQAWIENLQGPLSEFVTGNSPAMIGQEMADNKTAQGYAQARDMALGLMALVWVPFLQYASSINGQAARCASKRDSPKISAVVPGENGKSQTLDIDVDTLSSGGFVFTVDTDQGFPESQTETSNTWKQLKQAAMADPDLAEDFKLPENQAAFREAVGLEDFVNRSDDSRDLQLAEWSKIQQGEGPVVDQEATQQRDQQKQQMAQQAVDQLAPGQQAPPLPEEPPVMGSTVPIDPITDDHVVHALEMFRILNSPEGQKIKAQALPIWQDGKLHMMAHVAAAQAKGLIIPPPLGGAPPMPPPVPGAPGAGPHPAPPHSAPPNSGPTGAPHAAPTAPPS